MSLRLEMLQAARMAPSLLGESTGLVRRYLLQQQTSSGGFKNRQGQADLYYTVFGMDGLVALESITAKAVDSLRSYLRTFKDGEGLDLVHLCCLARGWATLSENCSAGTIPVEWRSGLQNSIAQFRAADGGYNPVAGSKYATPYGCYLAVGACQDLGSEVPDAPQVAAALSNLQHQDGSWCNASATRLAEGSTNATAAAVTTLRSLSAPVNAAAGAWLLERCHPQGGFLAAPRVPMPDLLSTATALHALAVLQVPLHVFRKDCIDFIDSLWTNEGGFHGHWMDESLDCEYTYYGVLALGHLA